MWEPARTRIVRRRCSHNACAPMIGPSSESCTIPQKKFSRIFGPLDYFLPRAEQNRSEMNWVIAISKRYVNSLSLLYENNEGIAQRKSGGSDDRFTTKHNASIANAFSADASITKPPPRMPHQWHPVRRTPTTWEGGSRSYPLVADIHREKTWSVRPVLSQLSYPSLCSIPSWLSLSVPFLNSRTHVTGTFDSPPQSHFPFLFVSLCALSLGCLLKSSALPQLLTSASHIPRRTSSVHLLLSPSPLRMCSLVYPTDRSPITHSRSLLCFSSPSTLRPASRSSFLLSFFSRYDYFAIFSCFFRWRWRRLWWDMWDKTLS